MTSKISHDQKGFTIVELLIVIIVIAILAAISIASFTAIQTRSRTNAGYAVATTTVKKLEALGSVKGGAFTDTTGGRTGAQLNTYSSATPAAPEAVFDSPSSVIAATNATAHNMSAANSNNGQRVSVYACPAGANIWYWDWSTSQAVRMTAGSGC